MAEIEIKDEESHMDITPSIRELAHAIKKGRITIVPNMYAQDGLPVLWVSLKDLVKLKRELGGDT